MLRYWVANVKLTVTELQLSVIHKALDYTDVINASDVTSYTLHSPILIHPLTDVINKLKRY
jgi:hypothetical protein